MNLEGKSFAFGLAAGGFGMGVFMAVVAVLSVGRIQAERDQARTDAHMAQMERDGAKKDLEQVKQQLAELQRARAAMLPAQPNGYDVLNAIRPGLGTGVAKVISQANQANARPPMLPQQTQATITCPAGSTPQTDPNWQGTRCVADNPQ